MFGFGSYSETDAIAVLKKDHRLVEDLFARFERESHHERRIDIATEIVRELAVHARAEEELLYPLALDALDPADRGLIWEATIEHGTLSGLIDALGGARADDDSFAAHLKVLKEYVNHHVREEEHAIFPKIRATGIDLEALGAQIEARKAELKRSFSEAAPPRRRAAPVASANARAAR